MNENGITVYGAHWCPDCRRSKQFLGEHRIPYKWVDIENDPEAERFITGLNKGKRVIPTILFADGSFLVEPGNAELASKLGLKTTAKRTHYDLIVAGGGPAGLTAAFYAARESIETLVIERSSFGGQAADTARLENMPGFPDGISGFEFSQRLRSQAERFGVELLEAQNVSTVYHHDNYHCVTTSGGSDYSARAVLISTGSHYRRLKVPGENDYLGAGVHFCSTCDGPFYKGKRVVTVGGGNSAAQESLFLTKFAGHVTILVRSDHLKASQIIQDNVFRNPKIDIKWHTEVQEFIGEHSSLKQLRLKNNDTGREELMEVDGAFIFIGLEPNTDFLEGSDVSLNQWGFIVTGHELIHAGILSEEHEKQHLRLLETSVPGVFAAGDVRYNSIKQVASAIGEGAGAALMIRDYLRRV